MIVIEDPAQATEHSTLVKKNGYTVAHTVSWGEAAVKITASGHPAIVIIALSIPGRLDLIATAEQIQAKQNCPVIFIATFEDEAKHSCTYGYIAKSFDERELRIALELAWYRHDAEKKIHLYEEKFKKYRAHLEAVITRRTADLKKTNAQLQRLLHFIELTERKLATDSLEVDRHDEKEIPISIEEEMITADTDLKQS